jgi:hypothetical protein
VSHPSVGDTFEAWARSEPDVRVVLMLGSRARSFGEIGSSDEGSDWDFHVVTSNIKLFLDAAWAERAQLPKPFAYVARSGRLSPVTKSSAIFPSGEIDIVLLPLTHLRAAKALMRFGLAQRIPSVRNALADLTLVLLPGYRVVKGDKSWSSFFSSVVSQIPSPRLDNHTVCELAEAYVIDYISTRRKINRGEFMAGQRWLHIQLAETNFRLLHELRLRSHKPTFPDGRRLELLPIDQWLDGIRVSALPNRESLLAALEKSAETCRAIVGHLVGTAWKWPREIP